MSKTYVWYKPIVRPDADVSKWFKARGWFWSRKQQAWMKKSWQPQHHEAQEEAQHLVREHGGSWGKLDV